MTDNPTYVLITALLMNVVYLHREIRDAIGFAGSDWIWFGLHLTTQWEWINSTPADANSIHWYPGQPNGDGNCAYFYSYSGEPQDLLSGDYPCSYSLYSLCEYKC